MLTLLAHNALVFFAFYEGLGTESVTLHPGTNEDGGRGGVNGSVNKKHLHICIYTYIFVFAQNSFMVCW